jgi:hypothetical protein
MSIDPLYWGPGTWKLFYSIAYTYPEKPSPVEKNAVFNFFTSLKILLPCEKCKDEYTKYITLYPPRVDSKTSLQHWILNLHNSINVRLNKPLLNDRDIQLTLETFDSLKQYIPENHISEKFNSLKQHIPINNIIPLNHNIPVKRVVPTRNLIFASPPAGIKIVPNPTKSINTFNSNISKNKVEKPILNKKEKASIGIRNSAKTPTAPIIRPACNCRKPTIQKK